MPAITKLVTWEGLILLFVVFGSVLVRILTGAIRTRGLIEGATPSGSRFISAGRVQLLIVTLVSALQYLAPMWHNPQTLPDVPRNWLLFLGGSQVLYLGSKFHGKRSRRFHI